MRSMIAVFLISGVAAGAFVSEAAAQSRRHHHELAKAYVSEPLTVNRRSWLDPGPVQPRNTGNAYIAASTQFNKTPDQVFAPDGFGNDVIKGQPYIPGRPVAVASYSTLPSGDVSIDDVLGPQNYYFNPAPSEPR